MKKAIKINFLTYLILNKPYQSEKELLDIALNEQMELKPFIIEKCLNNNVNRAKTLIENNPSLFAFISENSAKKDVIVKAFLDNIDSQKVNEFNFKNFQTAIIKYVANNSERAKSILEKDARFGFKFPRNLFIDPSSIELFEKKIDWSDFDQEHDKYYFITTYSHLGIKQAINLIKNRPETICKLINSCISSYKEFPEFQVAAEEILNEEVL